MERENRRDFDSLILDVRRLLSREQFVPALEAIRQRFRLLIVDEFQDTDGAQRDIAFAIGGLAGPPPSSGESPRLFLVGDPKQSIYGFRNADVRVWNEVESRLRESGTVLRLSRNFRSDPALVRLVNEACGPAFAAAGSALESVDRGAVVPYGPLEPGREASRGAGVDWLATAADLKKAERTEHGAALLAGRIAALLGRNSGSASRGSADREGALRADDIAVLAVRSDTLSRVEAALRERGIPTYNASSRGLAERQEVLDAINALRLVDNPLDDLRALAFLRSPFVGLRDEVIARIRLDRSIDGRGLLDRAKSWLAGRDRGEIEPFEAPEHPLIDPTERFALRRGLEAISEVCSLVGRAEPAELLDTLLARTSYRLHLRLRTGYREAESNLDRLRLLLGQFRFLSLADFLRAWDEAAGERRAELETASPPAAAEGSVFLSTIHGAKGLEWPVVAIAGAEDGGGECRIDATSVRGSHESARAASDSGSGGGSRRSCLVGGPGPLRSRYQPGCPAPGRGIGGEPACADPRSRVRRSGNGNRSAAGCVRPERATGRRGRATEPVERGEPPHGSDRGRREVESRYADSVESVAPDRSDSAGIRGRAVDAGLARVARARGGSGDRRADRRVEGGAAQVRDGALAGASGSGGMEAPLSARSRAGRELRRENLSGRR
ncbi:MAG: UvrD-helicase domain-containing protein [Gemmatimonadota bacterium]